MDDHAGDGRSPAFRQEAEEGSKTALKEKGRAAFARARSGWGTERIASPGSGPESRERNEGIGCSL